MKFRQFPLCFQEQRIPFLGNFEGFSAPKSTVLEFITSNSQVVCILYQEKLWKWSHWKILKFGHFKCKIDPKNCTRPYMGIYESDYITQPFMHQRLENLYTHIVLHEKNDAIVKKWLSCLIFEMLFLVVHKATFLFKVSYSNLYHVILPC